MYSMRRKIYHNYYRSILEKMNKREEELSRIRTSAQVEERKNKIKEEFLELTGCGDEDNKLISARVVGEINQGDYKIEKVIYEALPDYFIPGNLYLPLKKHDNRRPALLLPVGHDPLGKASYEYQKLASNLAKKGYIAFVYDPIGQGERDMLPHRIKERARNDMWCVEQHMRAGNPNYLMGNHLSFYFINDSKRAIDYLLTRDEIDPDKIGAIGRSGGGTNTAYLCTIEERLKLAIPIHFTTNFKRMLRKSSPGDVEQTFFGYIDRGLDVPDLYWPFIGRPLLLNLGVKDFFPIEGAREAYQELKRMYSILNQEEKVAKVEFNIGHEPAKEIRESCYNWVNKWFGSGEENAKEEDVEVLDERELFCTEEGNIAKIGKTVFEINKEMYNELKKNYNIASRKKFVKETIELLGPEEHYFRDDNVFNESNYFNTDNSYRIMTFYDNEENSSTCEFWYKKSSRLMVLLDFKGRFSRKDIINKSENCDIVKVNLPGQEITRKSISSDETGYDDDYIVYLLSILNGESIIATRIKHTLHIIKYLLEEMNINYQIELVGTGQGGIITLFTALLLGQNIARLTATDFNSLYGDILNNVDYKICYSSLLPDILKKYDLDILSYYVACLAGEVRLVNLVDVKGEVEDIDTIQKKYQILLDKEVPNISFNQDLADYSGLLT